MARDCTSMITASPLLAFETDAEVRLADARIVVPPSAVCGDGCVRANAIDVAEVGTTAFMLLITPMAPYLLCCADEEGLRHALGSAVQPSGIAQAIWFCEQERVACVAEADQALVSQSVCVAVFPFTHALRLADAPNYQIGSHGHDGTGGLGGQRL